MARGDRPVGRIKLKTRDGRRYDVATLWPGNRPDSHGVSPEKSDDLDAQYPKMRLSEAARIVEQGGGYLDVWMTAAPQETRRNQRPSSDVDDSDIPF